MWIRRSSLLALSLLLVLASTAGLANHEHALDVEAAAYDCAVDHQRGPGPQSQGPSPELGNGGPRHRHHCIGCHHGGFRFFFVATREVAGPSSNSDPATEVRSLPRASLSWSSRTLRGPPSA